MPDAQLLNRLEVLGELKENENQDEMKKRLMFLETTRNLFVNSFMTDDLAHVLNCKVVTLEEGQKSIMSGKISLRNSMDQKTKPLSGLKKHELEQELESRGIYDDGRKDELQSFLNKEMRGKQRVPALLFNNPQASLSELCLQEYEILPCEPLHDVGHHIENVFTELPAHLKDQESKVIEESL